MQICHLISKSPLHSPNPCRFHPSTLSVLLIESTPSFPRIAFSSLQLQTQFRHILVVIQSSPSAPRRSLFFKFYLPRLVATDVAAMSTQACRWRTFPQFRSGVTSPAAFFFIQIQVSCLSLYAMLDKPRLFYRLRPDSVLTNPRFWSYPTPSSSPGCLLSASQLLLVSQPPMHPLPLVVYPPHSSSLSLYSRQCALDP